MGLTRSNSSVLLGVSRKSDSANVHLRYDLDMPHGWVRTTVIPSLSWLAVRLCIVVRARSGGIPFELTDTTVKVYH